MAMFDCDFDTREIIPALRERAEKENFRFYIGRYISTYTKSWKVITTAEYVALAAFHQEMQKAAAAAGSDKPGECLLWMIFEDKGKPRSRAEGAANALTTRRWISNFNMPLGAGIYYTSDEDGPVAPVLAATKAYYDGLRDAAGNLIVTPGLYASGRVAEAAFEAGIIKVRWPTMSTGFSGTKEALQKGEWEMKQGLEVHYAGKVVDPDTVREGVNYDTFGFFPATTHVGAQGLVA